MKKINTIFILLVIHTACIDPLDVRVPVYKSQLVVDGSITEGPGPHGVKLFLASNLETWSEFNSPEPVRHAQVIISSNDGESVSLSEVNPGVYETAEGAIIGTIGKSYQLNIQTLDQREYQSTFQLMRAAGEINDLYFEFTRDYLYDPETQLFRNAFLLYLNSTSDTNSLGLLRWRYTGIYEIYTQPEERITVLAGGSGPVVFPDPPECSGHVPLGPGRGNTMQVEPCTCCSCWVYEYNTQVRLSKKQFVQNNTFNRVLIAAIPIDQWRFYFKYSLEVEQLSLSEDVYDFWNKTEAQQKGAGSLFQPNTVIIQGNMRSITNPAEVVLGIFSASGIQKKRIFITRNDVPYGIDQGTYREDCREFDKNSVTTRPLFW